MYPWWTESQAGWVGAIGGTLFGAFGAVFGIVAGLGAPRGKFRGTVYAMTALLACIGIGSLTAGLLALALHQSRGVWYPLVLIGGMGTFMSCWVIPLVRHRYREADNRRLDAEQFRRG
ncbi:MAG TPA: hypothetical protein VFE47_25400 [Tepidisphaeraceae bacterium]|jgi:hypothetical protein|nr:hypothetical protein [Tepidisphaeraceae bacterium]